MDGDEQDTYVAPKVSIRKTTITLYEKVGDAAIKRPKIDSD